MKKRKEFTIILLALISGLIGGFISNQLFSTKSAFVEKEPKPHKVVIAEEFRLINEKGNVLWSAP